MFRSRRNQPTQPPTPNRQLEAPATSLPDQLSPQEAMNRARQAIAATKDIHAAFAARVFGAGMKHEDVEKAAVRAFVDGTLPRIALISEARHLDPREGHYYVFGSPRQKPT